MVEQSEAHTDRRTSTDGDFRVWFRADETDLRGDESARLAGRTTDDVPLAGTADAGSLGR